MMVQNYHTNYYTLLLIPLGIVFYLLIKLGSDFSISNRDLIINSSNYFRDKPYLDQLSDLFEKIDTVQKINDRIFMIKGMPIKVNELEFESNSEYYCRYLAISLTSKGNMKVHDGMLLNCNEKSYYEWFAVRKGYDEFIKTRNFTLSKMDNVAKFLNRNSIFVVRNLNLVRLNSQSGRKVINLFTFCPFNDRVFENKKSLFAEGNALLLFLSANNLIKVANC
jgi:hypothetical protein